MAKNSNGRYVDAPNSAAGTSDDSSPKWPPGSASPFAVVDALAGLVESVSHTLAMEDSPFAEDNITVDWWCELGRWIGRATLALDSIRAPEEARHPAGGWLEREEVPAQGWFGVECIDRNLLPLRTRLRAANEDADRIARALGSDLETVLERCFGMGVPVRRSLVRIVLRPFLRAFQGCAEGSEYELSELRESVWLYYGDDPSDSSEQILHPLEWLPDPAPEAPADGSELAAAPPSGNGTAVPSWNRKTMTLSYKCKTTSFDKTASTVPKVFDWFQDAGWPKTVKVQDYDVIENGAQISNLVSRARAKALKVGFTIKRSDDELEWADKRNQQEISVNCDADSS